MTYVIIWVMLPTIYYLCNCNGSISTSWTSSGSRNLSHVVHAVKAVPGSITENSMEGVNAQILVLCLPHISCETLDELFDLSHGQFLIHKRILEKKTKVLWYFCNLSYQ